MNLKETLKTSCPRLYQTLFKIYQHTPLYRSALNRALIQRRHREIQFLKTLFQENLTVLAGPFAGLRYVEQASGSVLLPKLLGTYEACLQPWIAETPDRNYSTLLDIGCAEGYYAVGLARNCPGMSVVAYDLNDRARDLCKTMAQANGVSSRVQVKTRCNAEEISHQSGDNTLIICDIEGAEYELLDPEKIPALLRADLIVEAHDHLNPDITPSLRRRFGQTHHIETVCAVAPAPALLAPIAHLPEEEQGFILDEQRTPHMLWHRFLRRSG